MPRQGRDASNLGIMHNPDIKARTIAMCRAGVPTIDIARKLGIPAGTVGHWKFTDRARHPQAYPAVPDAKCPICLGSIPRSPAYSYLLGQYLGDGYIISKRKNHHLAITYCDDYPMIKNPTECAMRDMLPGASTTRVRKTGCTDVKSYSRHWTCLFPQHGPGMKHTRKIELAGWQADIVKAYPSSSAA